MLAKLPALQILQGIAASLEKTSASGLTRARRCNRRRAFTERASAVRCRFPLPGGLESVPLHRRALEGGCWGLGWAWVDEAASFAGGAAELVVLELAASIDAAALAGGSSPHSAGFHHRTAWISSRSIAGRWNATAGPGMGSERSGRFLLRCDSCDINDDEHVVLPVLRFPD